MNNKERIRKIIAVFAKENPSPKTELSYKTPYELIVAVILSAQCTDVRVNKITPGLFEKIPDFKSMAVADIVEIYECIKSCSYPNNKAKNLKGMAEMVVNELNGQLPKDESELQKLPGVGRKTANVVASVLYSKAVMAVDTHVFRVARRIGLAKDATTPLAVEKAIMLITPKKDIPDLHHWLILHGRYICKAQKPLCVKCPITSYCDYFRKTPVK